MGRQGKPVASGVTGRPHEIEEIANRLWVHPASRRLVDVLVGTRVTPNQVSAASVVAAAAAAVSFARNPLGWGPIFGAAGLFVWHVLDGADGDLARRTGKASPLGELIDGVCDHVSQALIYVSLAIVLQRTLGGLAWILALGAAVSHTLQANCYEAGRKTYRHWVYGAPWMRQHPDVSRSWAGAANKLYLRAAAFFSPNEDSVETAMADAFSRSAHATAMARAFYKTRQAELVKRSGILGATSRSIAMVASMLAGTPLWFFVYEIVLLNVAMICFVEWRRRLNRKFPDALSRLGPELQPS